MLCLEDMFLRKFQKFRFQRLITLLNEHVIVSLKQVSSISKLEIIPILSWLIADYVESPYTSRDCVVQTRSCVQPILVLHTMMLNFSMREYAGNIVVLMIFTTVETTCLLHHGSLFISRVR